MKIFALTVLSILIAVSAQAKTYPISGLTAALSVDCSTQKIQIENPPFYVLSTISTLNGQAINLDDFSSADGSQQGFSYAIDADQNLVLTKKGSFFSGKDVSIPLGKPNLSTICDASASGSAEFFGANVPIDLFPTLSIQDDLELTGICYPVTRWPNESGFSYLHPLSKTILVSDSKSQLSLEIKIATDLDFSDWTTCRAAALP